MIFNMEKESVTLALGSFIVFLEGVMLRISNICSYYALLQTSYRLLLWSEHSKTRITQQNYKIENRFSAEGIVKMKTKTTLVNLLNCFRDTSENLTVLEPLINPTGRNISILTSENWSLSSHSRITYVHSIWSLSREKNCLSN